MPVKWLALIILAVCYFLWSIIGWCKHEDSIQYEFFELMTWTGVFLFGFLAFMMWFFWGFS